MIKKRRFPKIYFGWWTVLTAGVLNLWTAGFQAYGFSALFKPIASELGFSRAATSVAASIGQLEGGIEAPIAGWLTDKYGPRGILLFGVFLASLGLILMNFIDSLWAFYLVWGVILGTAASIIYSIPSDAAITNWFVKKRGVAMGTKGVLSGLSGALMLPLVARLIIGQGWRMTCVIGGVVMGTVGLPLVRLFIRPHGPEYYGLLPDGATAEEEVTGASQGRDRVVAYAAGAQEIDFTLRQALKTPTFWLLIVAQASHSLAMPIIMLHGIPFLTDIGMEPLRAAGVVALMIAVGIPLRFAGGLLGDLVSKNRLRFIVGGAYLLQALGLVIFLQNQTIPMIYVWFLLWGIGTGLARTPIVMIRARYFGRRAFGSISGVSRGIMTPAMLVGPIWLGWVYDTTGSYINAFTLIAAVLAGSAILTVFAVPPKPPAQVTGIHETV